MMRNKLLKILSAAVMLVTTATSQASEIGAEYQTYKSGDGKNFFADFDLKYGLKVNVGFSNIKLEGDQQVRAIARMKYLEYGVGYNYNLVKGIDVYANISKGKITFDDNSIVVVSGEEKAVIAANDIKGYEYKLGVKYRFLKDYEIDIKGKVIDYKNMDSVETFLVTTSYYLTKSFKINATYADNSFVNESSYNVGLSYNF